MHSFNFIATIIGYLTIFTHIMHFFLLHKNIKGQKTCITFLPLCLQPKSFKFISLNFTFFNICLQCLTLNEQKHKHFTPESRASSLDRQGQTQLNIVLYNMQSLSSAYDSSQTNYITHNSPFTRLTVYYNNWPNKTTINTKLRDPSL